jgi:hypothetical protein
MDKEIKEKALKKVSSVLKKSSGKSPYVEFNPSDKPQGNNDANNGKSKEASSS